MKTNKSSTEPLWKSVMILGEEDWQIDIVLGHHNTEDEATKIAQTDTLEAILDMHDGVPVIVVTSETGSALYGDDNAVITEISQEKKAKMGRPLDMSVKTDKEIAIKALLTHDTAYIISLSDMVPSNKTLADFINRYGAEYRLDHIAWGVSPVFPHETENL